MHGGRGGHLYIYSQDLWSLQFVFPFWYIIVLYILHCNHEFQTLHRTKEFASIKFRGRTFNHGYSCLAKIDPAENCVHTREGLRTRLRVQREGRCTVARREDIDASMGCCNGKTSGANAGKPIPPYGAISSASRALNPR